MFTNRTAFIYLHRNPIEANSVHDFLDWLTHSLVLVLTDLIVLVAAVTALLFTLYQGIGKSYGFVIVTFLIFVFWALYIKNLWSALNTREHGKIR